MNFVPKERVFSVNSPGMCCSRKKAVLLETYGYHVLSKSACRNYFKDFKNNEEDYDQIEALLDENSCLKQI